MSKYIRVHNKMVAEVFINTTNQPIEELFHCDVVAQFEPCNVDGVQVGWMKTDDGRIIPPPQGATETIPTSQV